MVNPSGRNGNNKIYPPDNVLSESLHQYARIGLKRDDILKYLLKDHNLQISIPQLTKLNKKFKVPSVRKPPPMEHCASLVANKLAQDTRQLQGPNTIRQLVAQQDAVRIPRDMIRVIQKALAPDGADLRRPGKRPKKIRGTLNGIGIFEEIHGDGHEKLSAKALRMGEGIGMEIYGFRDHTGLICNMTVVPKSRCPYTVAHVYLDMVEKYQAFPIQITIDGGTEVGWLTAIHTTLREMFSESISVEDRKAVVSMPSTLNIPIESAWWFNRRFVGLNIADVLQRGHDHMHTSDFIHVNLWRWLWPRIVQKATDEFVFWFNNHPTKKQIHKKLPSGVSPQVVFDFPKDHDLEDLRQPVSSVEINMLRASIPKTREEVYCWVSDEFDTVAQQVYAYLGSPEMTLNGGWDVFDAMAPLIRTIIA
ncbi:hypothetical protein C8J56DRAFT_1057353 [Mycena floridula]|nr:hypothetical protein C8J56DRAFT_1057353 [Mycena floridula]